MHMEKMNQLRPLILSVKQPTPDDHAHRSKTVKEGEVLEVPEVHWDCSIQGMLEGGNFAVVLEKKYTIAHVVPKNEAFFRLGNRTSRR